MHQTGYKPGKVEKRDFSKIDKRISPQNGRNVEVSTNFGFFFWSPKKSCGNLSDQQTLVTEKSVSAILLDKTKIIYIRHTEPIHQTLEPGLLKRLVKAVGAHFG